MAQLRRKASAKPRLVRPGSRSQGAQDMSQGKEALNTVHKNGWLGDQGEGQNEAFTPLGIPSQETVFDDKERK